MHTELGLRISVIAPLDLGGEMMAYVLMALILLACILVATGCKRES